MNLSIEDLGFDRALIVQGNWCDLILQGSKSWELRSSKTTYRGPFGLIKSCTGLIYGKADLVDSLDALSDDEFHLFADKHKASSIKDIGNKWRFPWVVSNPVTFGRPLFYKHPLGAVIWVKLNDEMLQQADSEDRQQIITSTQDKY